MVACMRPKRLPCVTETELETTGSAMKPGLLSRPFSSNSSHVSTSASVPHGGRLSKRGNTVLSQNFTPWRGGKGRSSLRYGLHSNHPSSLRVLYRGQGVTATPMASPLPRASCTCIQSQGWCVRGGPGWMSALVIQPWMSKITLLMAV